MPQQTLISVWYRVSKRLLCSLIQAVTVQRLCVFLGQPHRKVSVLRFVSPIQRVTHTLHIQRFLWPVPQVCGSLREALGALDADRDFLKAGNVFDDDQIDAYIDLKMEEVHRLALHPHPVEFDMYYKC